MIKIIFSPHIVRLDTWVNLKLSLLKNLFKIRIIFNNWI